MKNKKLIAAGVLLLTVAPSAMANGISWDYLAAAWNVGGNFEADPFDVDLEGYQFSAVKSLGSTMFFSVGTDQSSFESGPGMIDFSMSQFGFGGHYAVSPTTDLWASLNYQRGSFGGAAGTGSSVDVGVRWQAASQFELDVTAKVSGSIDFDVVDGDYTGYDVVGLYSVSPMTAITLSYSDYEIAISGGELKFAGITRLGVRFAY